MHLSLIAHLMATMRTSNAMKHLDSAGVSMVMVMRLLLLDYVEDPYVLNKVSKNIIKIS